MRACNKHTAVLSTRVFPRLVSAIYGLAFLPSVLPSFRH